jgi:membrane-anchored glycerophosphoryl diester phosphodiesterase (GDPDase)
MSDFINSLTSGDIATELTMKSVLMILASSIIIGLIISIVYLITHRKDGYSQAFCVALILLSPIVALVILLIGNNVARAFSLAGAFALIRFRSAPGDPKDIAFVFMSVVMGLACGMGYYAYAAVATS